VIKTRFSPSPTGLLHLGNVRAALFSALYAAKNKGVFILRIEDTDAARSDLRFVESLQDDLHWLGVSWQEGPGIGGPHVPYFQSQRQTIYDQFYQLLESEKLAYSCFCSEQELMLGRKIQLSRGQAPRYSGACLKLTQEDIQQKIAQGLKPALRFKIPAQTMIEFVDTVKGPQRFNSDDIGDFIIRRADGSSSFMFCNAIDDSLMGVTHVLRGEDHLANTPRQIMILSALHLRIPHYGHLSLIMGDDGSPLSKRHGSFSLHDLRTQGFLSQAVLNYLARLSHSYDSQDLMSFAGLAHDFQLEKISRSAARFDLNQLMFWQKQGVMALDNKSLLHWMGDEVAKKIDQEKSDLFLEIVRQNVLFPQQGLRWATIFFEDNLAYSEENKAILAHAGEQFFVEWLAALDQFDDFKKVLDTLKNHLNLSGKPLFLPIRVALTGEQHGPELAQMVTLLGKEKLKHRVKQAKAVARLTS
jgi:nondiscriminating glutamyl-tRNA synthetase